MILGFWLNLVWGEGVIFKDLISSPAIIESSETVKTKYKPDIIRVWA
jgi:hypothetical protein